MNDVVAATFTPPNGVSTLFVAFTVAVPSGFYINWQANSGSGFVPPTIVHGTDVVTSMDPVLLQVGNQLFCFYAAARYNPGQLAWSIYNPATNTWSAPSFAAVTPPIGTGFTATVVPSSTGGTKLFFTYGDSSANMNQVTALLSNLIQNPPIIGDSEIISTQEGETFVSKDIAASFVIATEPSPTLYIVFNNALATTGSTVLFTDAKDPVSDSWSEYAPETCQGFDSSSGFQASTFAAGGCDDFIIVAHRRSTGEALFNIFVPQVSGWLGDYYIDTDGVNNLVVTSVPRPVVWNDVLYVFYRGPDFDLYAVKASL